MDTSNSQKSTEEEIGRRNNEPVSMSDIPLAIGCLLDDVAEIKSKIESLSQCLGIGATGIRPVTIKEAAIFLSLPERSIRKMVKEETIPFYRRNGKIYFFEKELLEWIKESRVATIDEQLRSYQMKRRRR